MPKRVHKALFEAQQMLEKEQPAQAAQRLAQFRKNHPKLGHHRLFFMLGVLAYQAGDLKLAEKRLARAIRLYPCYGLAWRNLAVMQYENQKYLAAARSALNANALSNPPDPELLYQASIFYLEGQKPKNALPYLEALAAQPQPKPAWLKALIRTRLALKQWKAAAKTSRRLLAMLPGDAAIWRLAAGVELRRKRYRRAAADLEVAFRLKPPDKDDCRQMAEVCRAAGLPKQAAAWHRKAMAQSPRPEQWEKLARIYRQAGLLDRALDAAQKALAQPTADRHLLLAQLHLQKRQYGKAAQAYAQAGRLGKKASYFMQAAQCAWQNDNLERAQKLLQKALAKAKPKSKLQKQTKKMLQEIKNHKKESMARNAQASQFD